MTAFGSRISRITAIIETVLPEPDSPTIPTTSPASSDERQPVDRAHDAVLGAERDAEVAHLEQRRQACRTRGSSQAYRRSTSALASDDEERRVHHRRHDHRQVEVLQRVVRELADAVQAEHDLGRAARRRRRARRSRARTAMTKATSDVRSACRSRTRRSRQPLRARGAHVVLLLRLDERRAQHAGVDADVEHRQREPGEEQRLEPAERRLA